MRKRASQCLIIGLAILLSAGLATAAGTNDQRGNAISKNAAGFLQKAIESGMMQVKLGQLAQGKASSERVREFGQRMVKEHTAADEELRKLAEKKDVAVPKDLRTEQKSTVDRLATLSGKTFDRQYMKTMVEDHTKEIKDFDEEAKQARDPDVEEFAAKHIPVLDEYLNIAQSIAREIGANLSQQQSRQ